jgi:anti-anti-sigma regulatory factor
MPRTTAPSDPPEQSASWTLAAQSDRDGLMHLQTFLSAHRDQPVEIEGSALHRADTVLMQLLVSACRDWTARGIAFRLTGMPERVRQFLPLLGLTPEMIGIEVC